MINNNKPAASLLLLAALAAGQVHAMAERPVEESSAPTLGAGDGVLVASTRMGTGPAAAVGPLGQPLDCSGDGPSVVVTSVQGQQRWQYDADGEPCNQAGLLFDGTGPLGMRAADPAVNIGFMDSLGPIPSRKLGPATPRLMVKSDDLKMGMPTPEDQPVPLDKLTETIQKWQGQVEGLSITREEVEISEQSEATLAALRDLDREVEDISGQREKVAEIMARLRERERELAAAEARAKANRMESQQQRNAAEAALGSAQQAQQNMRAELEAAKERLAVLEAQNKHLAVSKARQEKVYQERLIDMSGDLKTAEAQAQQTRKELVVQAAAKIAEAEALANAARMAEADAKAREAARLKLEAETMLNRALELQENKAIIAAGLQGAVPDAAPMALMDVPVVVHATDVTLPDLLATILKQAGAQAGEWKGDFQLTSENSYILAEKWSLTAEAPVAALLKNLTEQVKSAHGVTLTFTRFPQSRLVVVTDNKEL